MNETLLHSQTRIAEFFGRDLAWDAPQIPELSPAQARNFERLNLQWHVVPPADALPLSIRSGAKPRRSDWVFTATPAATRAATRSAPISRAIIRILDLLHKSE